MPTLFFCVAYLIFGIASASGIRFKGLRQWDGVGHVANCHFCDSGHYDRYSGQVRFNCDDKCLSKCVHVFGGNHPIPVSQWIFYVVLWPLIDIYVLSTWIIRAGYATGYATGRFVVWLIATTFFWVPKVLNYKL